MNLPKDFSEFIALLNEKNVRYLLIGGYAVAYHSRPKLTEDIDFWIESTTDNAHKMVSVMNDFGFASLGLTQEDFLIANQVIQLGYPPLRIDLLTNIAGLDFESSFKRCVIIEIDSLKIPLLSIEDLIENKKASGRKKDLFDINWLKTYKKRRYNHKLA